MNPSPPLSLTSLLAPRSIAVLGASERVGSIGAIVLESLKRMGFEGDIWPINPKYEEVFGLRSYDKLESLPGVPDVTAICLSGKNVPAQIRTLGLMGARAAVVYDGGFAEAGDEGARAQEELVSLCRAHGIALCGPNCMGAVNLHGKATTYKLPILEADRLKGHVGLVSQSGSVTIGLLGDVRRFGFSHVISTGNEAVVTAADYIEFLIGDAETHVIALFLESVKSPERFRDALEKASRAGKPVVVLKVGRSKRAMEAVVSHTGGLAGEARVFSELLRRAGAIEVRALDEMSEVLAALQLAKRPAGERMAVITGSGGHTELILDAAESHGFNLPPLEPAELAEVEKKIGHFSGDGNPLDAWGAGDVRNNLAFALKNFATSPHYDAVVLCNENIQDAPIGRSEAVCAVFCEAAAQSDKPHYLLNTRPGLMHDQNLVMLAKAGAGMLGGVQQGLGAIRSVARWANRTPGQPTGAPSTPSPIRHETRRMINEYEAKALLSAYGVPSVPECIVDDIDQAIAAARQLGWPVVLKVVSDNVAHKTEAGLVYLDIRDADSLNQAWGVLTARGKAACGDDMRMLVQKMVKGGVELFVGVKRDPHWGPAIAFGIGGTLIELINETALDLLPIDAEGIERLISGTRAAHLLQGARGAPPADIQALRNCIASIADFSVACGDDLAEMDLNPIKVLPDGQGCFVLDAVIVTRHEAGDGR